MCGWSERKCKNCRLERETTRRKKERKKGEGEQQFSWHLIQFAERLGYPIPPRCTTRSRAIVNLVANSENVRAPAVAAGGSQILWIIRETTGGNFVAGTTSECEISLVVTRRDLLESGGVGAMIV